MVETYTEAGCNSIKQSYGDQHQQSQNNKSQHAELLIIRHYLPGSEEHLYENRYNLRKATLNACSCNILTFM